MGKAFLGYQLEGLKRQGTHAVWIPLGVYQSEEALTRAKSARTDLVDFRRFDYYLDDCDANPVVRPSAAVKFAFDDTHLLA